MKQIRTVWKELNRSIVVGERLRHKLRVLTYVSLFCAALGLGLVIMDLVIGEKELVPAFATLLGGLGCAYFAGIKKSRKISVIFPCAFCIVMFTVYAFTGFMQGTGIFWTLLMPIGICYFVSVRFGIILAAFTLISMVQYHRMALRDIDYTQRLTAEEFDVIKSHATIGGKILERSAGMRGTQFDPALLDAFVSLADDGTLDAVCAQADAQLAHAVSLGLIENPAGIA